MATSVLFPTNVVPKTTSLECPASSEGCVIERECEEGRGGMKTRCLSGENERKQTEELSRLRPEGFARVDVYEVDEAKDKMWQCARCECVLRRVRLRTDGRDVTDACRMGLAADASRVPIGRVSM